MAALLFDLDGTLADSRQCLLSSIDNALETIGFKGLPYDRVLATQQDLATTLRQSFQAEGREVNDLTIDRFIDQFRRYHEQREDGISLYPNIQEVLKNLAPYFSLGVATTKDSKQAKRVIRKLRIEKYFGHVQGTDPGLRYKPSPDILLKSLKVLNKRPDRSFYVGDSVHDVVAARAGGLKSLGAGYGFSGVNGFKESRPDWMLRSPLDILGLKDQLIQTLT